MRIECNISEQLKVSLEAESFAEAELKISELMKDVLFRNDEIQKNALKFSHSVDAYFEDKGKCHQHYAEFTHCPVDTKRAAKWFPVTGLQLSGVKPFCGSRGTILTKEAFVKRKIEKILPEIRKMFSEEQEMSM